MKKVILILICLMALIVSGCESLKPKGFSVGVMYLNADMPYGEIKEVVPIGLLNFEFE